MFHSCTAKLLWQFFTMVVVLQASRIGPSTLFDFESPRGAGLCQVFPMGHKCHEFVCSGGHWDKVTNRNTTNNKIILSYSHNGLGNQMWEHSFAFNVAASLGARLFVALLPPALYPRAVYPENTNSTYEVIKKIVPEEAQFELLPQDSRDRKVCDDEPYYLSDRPFDVRREPRGRMPSKRKIIEILSDTEPRCLRIVGFFQHALHCPQDARKMWSMDHLARRDLLHDLSDAHEAHLHHRVHMKGHQNHKQQQHHHQQQQYHHQRHNETTKSEFTVTVGAIYNSTSGALAFAAGDVEAADNRTGCEEHPPTAKAAAAAETVKPDELPTLPLETGDSAAAEAVGSKGATASKGSSAVGGSGSGSEQTGQEEEEVKLDDAFVREQLQNTHVEIDGIAFFKMQPIPGPDDVCIYMRCLPSHYHFNSNQYIRTVLSRMKYDHIVVFMHPNCYEDYRMTFPLVAKGRNFVLNSLRAKRFFAVAPTLEVPVLLSDVSKHVANGTTSAIGAHSGGCDTNGTSSRVVGMHIKPKLNKPLLMIADLYALSQCKKMILPQSSWAMWAGLISNASEIHVGAPALHPLMGANDAYFYHREETGEYYGKYDRFQKKIVYDLKVEVVAEPV